MMDFFSQHWTLAIDWVSLHAVTPVVNALNIAEAAGDPREIAAGILIALLQLFLIGGVMRPLESLLPAERWAAAPAARKPAASRPGCPGSKSIPIFCLPCTT